MTEKTNEITREFRVAKDRWSDFETRFAKLQKTARRIGCAEPWFENLGELTQEVINQETGKKVVYAVIKVRLHGEAPKYNGWSLVAARDHVTTDNGSEVLVRVVPGAELPARYLEMTANTCDHCRTTRNRLTTYVLRHETGTYQHVGSNCLRDFLGHLTPEQIVAQANFVADFGGDEWDGWGGGGYYYQSLGEVAQLTALVIRKDGWMSKTRANQLGGVPATAGTVGFLSLPRPKDEQSAREWDRYMNDTQESDKQEAEAAIQWALALTDEQTQGSDYLHNLRVVARMGYVMDRMHGIAVSLVAAYQREQEKLKQQQIERAQTLDEYWGEVGKRNEVVVTILMTREIEGNYGLTTLHRMRTQAGHILTWFASGSTDMNTGDTWKIKATVKRHETYQGRKQTMVTRVACLEKIQAAA